MGRLAEAWRILMSGPVVKAQGQRGGGDSQLSGVFQASSPPRRGTQGLLSAYGTSPRLRASVDRISHSVAAVQWRLFRAKNGASRRARLAQFRASTLNDTRREVLLRAHAEDTEIESHPFLDLWDRPHPELTGSIVRSLMQTYIELVGEAYLLLERDASGVPREAWPIPPTWVRKLPTEKEPFFEFRSGQWNPPPVPKEDVIWLRMPHPSDPYGRGTGIAGTLDDELDSDEFAAKMIAARFYNHARPDLLVSLQPTEPGAAPIKEEEALRLQASWDNDYKGVEKTGRTRFTGAKIEVKELSGKFIDLDLLGLREFSRDAIVQSFGLPPEVVGILESSNRATISAAGFIFAKWVLVPRLDFTEDSVNQQMLPLFNDEGLFLVYDSPVPEDKELSLEAAKGTPEAFSLDDVRAMVGKEPLADGAGKVHPVRLNITLDDLEDGAPSAPAPPPPPAEPEPSDDDEPDEGSDGDEGGSEGPENDEGRESRPGPVRALRDLSHTAPGAAHWPERATQGFLTDGTMVLAWEGYDAATADACAAALGVDLILAKAPTDPRIETVLDSLTPDHITKRTEPLWSDELKKWIERIVQDLGIEPNFDLINPLIKRHLYEHAVDRIAGLVNEITKQHVRNALIEGVQSGEGAKQLARRVREVFGDADRVRSLRIARTEVVRSGNWGTWQAHRISGVVTKREWIGTPDDRVRDEHKPGLSNSLDGQIVLVGNPFVVGLGPHKGATGMFPGDFGVAALDINERCVTGAAPDDDEKIEESAADAMIRRAAVWQQEAKARKMWERRAASALRGGFREQETIALSVVAALWRKE